MHLFKSPFSPPKEQFLTYNKLPLPLHTSTSSHTQSTETNTYIPPYLSPLTTSDPPPLITPSSISTSFNLIALTPSGNMEPFNYQLRRPVGLDTDTNFEPKYNFQNKFPLRKGNFNTSGKAITVHVNQYKVLQWPQGFIQQYDVSFTPNTITFSNIAF